MDIQEAFAVPMIMFMIFVAPIWIIMHYHSKRKISEGLSEHELAQLNDLSAKAERMADRIDVFPHPQAAQDRGRDEQQHGLHDRKIVLGDALPGEEADAIDQEHGVPAHRGQISRGEDYCAAEEGANESLQCQPFAARAGSHLGGCRGLEFGPREFTRGPGQQPGGQQAQQR